jgi:hypothetical protein
MPTLHEMGIICTEDTTCKNWRRELYGTLYINPQKKKKILFDKNSFENKNYLEGHGAI